MRAEPDANRVSHFGDLDGIRGVLAVMVMLFHYGINVMIERVSHGLVRNSPWELSVDFFFVLSGCVLTRSYLRRPRPLGRRFIERVFRLVPVHLVTTLAFVPLVLVSPANPWFHGTRGRSWGALVADLTTSSTYFNLEQWNFAAWTIGIELYLPVILAAALPFLRKVPTPLLMVIFVALLVLEIRCVAEIIANGGAWTVKRGLIGLSLGGVLYLLVERAIVSIPRTRFVLPLLLGLLLTGIGTAGVAPWLAYPIPVLFVAIIVLGTNSRSILSQGPFAWLGTISYTLYLTHLPAKAWTYQALGVSDFNGNLVVKIALIIAVLAIATLLTRYIELPGIAAGKHLAQRFFPTANREVPAHS